MNRIDRLTAMLIFLQGRNRTTIDMLEERFGVGRRTIFRDIRALIQGGVPIGGDAGEGYFIVEGYHLPPVIFSKEEAASLLTGSKLIAHWGDRKTAETFGEAMEKIRSVLKYNDREFLSSLDKGVNIIPPGRLSDYAARDLHLEELQYAVAASRMISITYNKVYDGSTTEREIEPLGLVNYSAKWHLIAYCRLRKALRDFRTDRIGKMDLTKETFNKDDHPDYMEFLESVFMSSKMEEVEISFSLMVSRMMGDQKYYFGLIEERQERDRVVMRFYTPSIDYFARWLLSFGDQVEVRSPRQLRDRVVELIGELAVHHQT